MRSGTASFISTAAGVLSAWAGIGRLRSGLVAAGALLLGINGGSATVAEAALTPANDKWRIVCLHDAVSDGVIVFRLTPVGGQAVELKVPIKEGTYENDVARQILKVFRATLPKELYHLEIDDGEAVLVKKQLAKPTFLLEFVSHSVNGLGIRVEVD